MAENFLGEKRREDDLRRLPEEVENEIYRLAAMKKYQHGTGCRCRSKCPGLGATHYSKISKKTGIDIHTVMSYLDDGYRDKRNGISNAYYQNNSSEINKRTSKKDARRRYASTDKGKEMYKRSWLKWKEGNQQGIMTPATS